MTEKLEPTESQDQQKRVSQAPDATYVPFYRFDSILHFSLL